MAVIRNTARYGSDMVRQFGFEDGVARRRYRQDLDPLLKRAEFLAHRRDYKRRGSKYLSDLKAQVPVAVLYDYLGRRKIPLDVYARNEGGVRDKFYKWLLSNRDLCRLQPDYYTVNKPGQSQIVVPERAPNNSRFKGQSEWPTPSKTTAT